MEARDEKFMQAMPIALSKRFRGFDAAVYNALVKHAIQESIQHTNTDFKVRGLLDDRTESTKNAQQNFNLFINAIKEERNARTIKRLFELVNE